MVRLSFKKTAVIIVILSCFGDLVRSQKEEKTEVRSLGHRRGGAAVVGEQTVYVDRPYFLEQPVYYPYPYQYQYQYQYPTYTYQYPYTYSYQYPYGVPGYPYNYSYTYTRTTSRPGGIISRPVGYVSPLPYAPLPPPYLRYLGNETSSDRKLDIFVPEETMMRPSFINDISSVYDGAETNVGNHTQSSKHTTTSSTSESGNFDKNNDEVIYGGCPLSPNKVDSNNSREDLVARDKTRVHAASEPEMMHGNSTANLRILAKKGLFERVEEKVTDVFDGIKKKMSNKDDKLKDVEKEDENTSENHDNGDHNKTQNGSKMIKQVFNTIEDIVSTTLTR